MKNAHLFVKPVIEQEEMEYYDISIAVSTGKVFVENIPDDVLEDYVIEKVIDLDLDKKVTKEGFTITYEALLDLY